MRPTVAVSGSRSPAALGMRILIAALTVLAWTSAQATDTDREYFYNRKWIELHCATNTTTKEERLFVGRSQSPKYAEIVQFRKGITIRELIDRSPLKGKVVRVCVMWPYTK